MSFLRYIPNIKLYDQYNNEIFIHDLFNKYNLVIISMFYSTCKVKCQPLGKRMVEMSKFIGNKIELKERILYLYISLDPHFDNYKQRIKFKESIGCSKKNWLFTRTTSMFDIDLLRFKLAMYDYDKEVDSQRELHSGMSIIINAKMCKSNNIMPFENIFNAARKVLDICNTGLKSTDSILKNCQMNKDTKLPDILFSNIHTLNQQKTLPFLHKSIQLKFINYSKNQYDKNGFDYDPFSNNEKKSCCKCKK